MRKVSIIGLAAGIIALSAISCTKADDTLRYNNMTMGNITEGIFTSDQGNRFNVTEQNCPGDLTKLKRALIICDVLKQTADAENEYDIRLNYIADVLEKDAVAVSEIADLETYMNDPILIKNAWISGGYINFLITAPFKQKDGQAHEINLLHEYKDGVYKFQLRHDAKGEILKEEGDNSGLILAGKYVSFPINSIIKEDKAKFTLDWNSYVTDGYTVTSDTRTRSEDLNYTKSTFEHVPSTAGGTATELDIE